MTISSTILIITALIVVMLIVVAVREIRGLSNENETLTRQIVAYMRALCEVDADAQTIAKKIDDELGAPKNYILTKEVMDEVIKDPEVKSAYEEQSQQQEIAENFRRNARKAFGKGYAAFYKRVKKGMANGLNVVLEGAPSVQHYIFNDPHGPILLNEILSNKYSFFRIMSRTTNPADAVVECNELVHEIQTRKANLGKSEVDINPRTGKLYKTTKAQREASKKWNAKHPERNNTEGSKESRRKYVSSHAEEHKEKYVQLWYNGRTRTARKDHCHRVIGKRGKEKWEVLPEFRNLYAWCRGVQNEKKNA